LVNPRLPSKVTIETTEEVSLTLGGPPQPHKTEHEELTLTLPPPKPTVQRENVEYEGITLTMPTKQLKLEEPKPAKPAEIENRHYKDYVVGDFNTIEGGKKNVLEITQCDCPVEQVGVRIEKEGKELVFLRTTLTGDNKKQQVRRFQLPYDLALDRISAEYSRNSDGGKLTLTLTKPIPSAAAGNLGGQFTQFVVPPTPSASADSKVSVSAGQASGCFVFEMQGNSIHETEVVGELVDGDNVKFHCTVTIESEGVRKKGTQTFNLPSKVTIDHIETSDGGKVTKIHGKAVKSTPNSTGAAASAPAIQADTDVPVKNV